VLGKPILVPAANTTSLGSALFAFLAAGTFSSLEEAQDALCSPHREVYPDARDVRVYNDLFDRFQELYFSPLPIGGANSR